MKTYLKLFLCLWLTIASVHAQAQQVFKTTSISTIGYYEYVPQDYNSNSDKYPIVIFLHGIGERGTNTTDINILSQDIALVAKHGPPMYVKNGTQFPFILISPQLKDNYGTWPSSYVMEVLEHVKTYLRIDERRICITGLSLGGGGAWVAAQDYPELFAALAPVCGGYNSPSKACGIAAENLPTWGFHGDADTTVPMSKTVNMINAINACIPAPSPLAKLTIYPDVGHSCWTYAYRTDHSLHNPNVYEWMMSFVNTEKKGTKVPIASAGNDKAIAPGSTTITGAGTDADGTVASYEWTQLSGPNNATLANASTKTVTASNLVAGTYMFRLIVTDDAGITDSDYIKITVDPALANQLPVVNAGTDKTITLPINSVSLTGTASDPDGTITAYAWTKISGSTAMLSGNTTATLSASNLLQGSYTFRLTVTDNKGGKKYDDVKVTVNGSGTNLAPIVSAGSDKTIILPTKSITIVGSASDKDGTIALYQWSQLSGPTAPMSNTTTAKLWAYNLVAGTYSFRLTVTDNAGATAYDDMILSVQSTSTVTIPDVPPTVSAGFDKTITLPTKAITIVGSASDSDGTIASYLWTKVSGPVAPMSNTTTAKLWAYNLTPGTYVFKLTVTDDRGASASDQMTLTVKDVVTSTTSLGIENIIEEPTDVHDQEKVLGELTRADLKHSTVVIFNDAGEKLFHGEWTAENQNQVLNKKGLYIYNVVTEGRRTSSGKIVLR